METHNIGELVDQALLLCRKQGFTESSVYSKQKIFKAVIRKHEENGCSDYKDELLDEYVRVQKAGYDNGKLKKDSYSYKVKNSFAAEGACRNRNH